MSKFIFISSMNSSTILYNAIFILPFFKTNTLDGGGGGEGGLIDCLQTHVLEHPLIWCHFLCIIWFSIFMGGGGGEGSRND